MSVYDLAGYDVEGLAGRGERCGCGDEDCMHFVAAYPYCAGCGGHYREPVSPPGYRCAADRWIEAFDRAGETELIDVAATAPKAAQGPR